MTVRSPEHPYAKAVWAQCTKFLELSERLPMDFRRKFLVEQIIPAPKPMGLRTYKKFNKLLELELQKQADA